MKRYTFLVALFFGFCTASPEALAQGRIRFANDSQHLVYLTSDTCFLMPADFALAGKVLPTGGLTLSGVTLVADLWGGTSATALFKLTTTTFDPTLPGLLRGVNLVTPFASGTTAYFQVQVYDEAMGSYAAAVANGHYYGASPIFTTVTSSSIAYNSIVRSGVPSYSTWAVGGWPLDDAGYGPGALGAIEIGPIPEPSLMALVGLGAAMVLSQRKARYLPSRYGLPTR